MSLRYSRLRTLVFTVMLGLAAVRVWDYFDDVYVNVPKVESDTPIIIRICPEWETGKGYVEAGDLYFSQEKAIECTPGGGGG
jgi:hypothetical protein